MKPFAKDDKVIVVGERLDGCPTIHETEVARVHRGGSFCLASNPRRIYTAMGSPRGDLWSREIVLHADSDEARDVRARVALNVLGTRTTPEALDEAVAALRAVVGRL